MKKIISSVLAIILFIFFHSCRQQDEQDTAMIDTKAMKNNARKDETSRDSDTAQTTVSAPVKNPAIILPVTDPPPKDRDQWRTVNH